MTGTCAENPNATGEADRKIIMNGPDDPTLRIAPRTRDQEMKRLRRRTQNLVGAGPAVAVFGMLLALLFASGG